MRISILALACAVAAGICSAASAAEPNPLEPAVYWRVAFGAPHESPALVYGFALRHGSAPERAAPALVEFDVSPTGTLTRVAGIPISAQAFNLNHTDETDPESEPAARTPWYARQWVMWTALGLAATGAALEGLGEDDSHNSENNNNNTNSDGSGIIVGDVPGTVCVFRGVPPFPDTCVEAGLVSAESGRTSILPDREGLHWPDSGTGQMGDLIAR